MIISITFVILCFNLTFLNVSAVEDVSSAPPTVPTVPTTESTNIVFADLNGDGRLDVRDVTTYQLALVSGEDLSDKYMVVDRESIGTLKTLIEDYDESILSQLDYVTTQNSDVIVALTDLEDSVNNSYAVDNTNFFNFVIFCIGIVPGILIARGFSFWKW